jgi:hypothetical protein
MRESNRMRRGTRITIISCDDTLCPSIAGKRELWETPIEQRGGIVLDTVNMLDVSHYIVGMHVALNVDCWDIDEETAKRFMSPSIINPSKYLLLIPVSSIQNEDVIIEIHNNIYDDDDQRLERRKNAFKYPNDIGGICGKCDKAQINRNLLYTCSLYNHVMCKVCLVEWDEENNRANMSGCEQYTIEMKKFCQTTMGYEPTYLPTRVLLGYNYWLTEDKQKAVEEFLDFDYWVCYICRIRRENGRQKDTKSETFGFIHKQLFPDGSEIEASQILDNNERDLFARFGSTTIASPNDKSNENAIKLEENMTINLYSPVDGVAHKINCLSNWTFGSILNEILEVTGTHYSSDLVMYKVDSLGWEVELCDLKPGESVSDIVPNGVEISTSIRELRNDDYIILRMRTNHVIGARAHLEILGFFEPKFLEAVESISKIYSGFRRIGGDGNCYYRAVAFGLLEQFVVNSRANLLSLHDIFATVTYDIDSYEASAHNDLLQVLFEASAGNMWLDTEQLQTTFLTSNGRFDEALVRGCRNLLSTYLVTKEDDEMENGLDLKSCILSVYEDVTDMEAYCNKYVRRMGEDAEGAFLELGLLPSILRTSCVIHNLDLHHLDNYSNQKEIECPYKSINGDQLGLVHILLRPGHYDLLYPTGAVFSQPNVQFVESRSSRCNDTKEDTKDVDTKESKPLDFLTGDDDPVTDTKLYAESKLADSKESKDDETGGTALTELMEMCPDMSKSFALNLLKKYDFNVNDAANDYFTNIEAYSDIANNESEAKESQRVSSPLHKSEFPPDDSVKDRIYASLRQSMPEVPIQDLHDAVHIGNADDILSAQHYINAIAESDQRHNFLD